MQFGGKVVNFTRDVGSHCGIGNYVYLVKAIGEATVVDFEEWQAKHPLRTLFFYILLH